MNVIRRLVESDLDALMAVRSISYPGSGLEEAELRRIIATRLPFTCGLFEAGELACVATMWPLRMYLGGREVAMGGLAGVATAPEFRRGGRVRALLREALERLRDEGTGWCLEYPFDPRFYHRLGWQSVPCGSEVEIPSEYLHRGGPPVSARRLSLSEFASLAPVFESWAARYTFALTRQNDPRKPWTRMVSKEWLEDDGFLYTVDGGYVLFTLTQENRRNILTVEDYAYSGGKGRDDIFRFLGAMHGQAALIRMHLPDDDPVSLDHRFRHATPRRWPLQARVADLAAALGPLSAPAREPFRLRVHDELCPWNDGTFELTCAESGTSVARCGGEPDAELPIQTIPLLVGGAISAETALAQGQASGQIGPLTAIAGLSRGRRSFMPLSDAF
ncbi:MAG: GNAT family N-acetyltransferase [Trueperaceae bacterium]